MRNFSALVWREVFERRLLLLVSALLGLVPIAAAWSPWRPDRFTPEDVRTAVAMALLPLFGGAALLILGSTIVGRDLSEGRLGFYFSRPVSGWSLWLSRLVAAGALVVASVLLIAGPTAALHLDALTETLAESRSMRTPPLLALEEVHSMGWLALPPAPSPLALAGLGVLTLAALLALIHAASTVVRGRSAWVLADLAGLGVFAALVWAARDVLVREQALGALALAEQRLLLPWILGALVLAGGFQVTRGRVDLARGHRYLSSTLWPALIAGALVFGGVARFVVSSEVEDLERLFLLEASPDHEWLLAGGTVRHRGGARSAFLVDTRSERSWRLGSLDAVLPWKSFSADGGTLAWARCDSLRPPACRVWTKDLRNGDRPPAATEIAVEVFPTNVALSDDGTRLALAGNGQITVYDLASASLLAAVAAGDPMDLRFLSRDRLRFHEFSETAGGTWESRFRHLDVPSRQLVDADLPASGGETPSDRVFETLIYTRLSPGGSGVLDARTGRLFFDKGPFWTRRPNDSFVLADGRRIAAGHGDDHLTLQVVSREGEELRRLERSRVWGLQFGGELAAGRVVLALLESTPQPPSEMLTDLGLDPLPGWTTYTLDLETGDLEPLAGGLVPFRAYGPAPRSRLFLAGGEAVIRFDPDTGEHRVVLPALGSGLYTFSQITSGRVPFEPWTL